MNFGGLKFEKMCVLTYFWGFNKIRYDVYSCLFCALSKYEKTIGSHVLLELRQYSNCHNTLKSMESETVFHTRSNLLCLV